MIASASGHKVKLLLLLLLMQLTVSIKIMIEKINSKNLLVCYYWNVVLAKASETKCGIRKSGNLYLK